MIRQGSPFVGLSLLLWYVSFDRMWPEVLRCTHPAYIDALIRWGRANLARDGDRGDYISFPDDVCAAWHQAWRNQHPPTPFRSPPNPVRPARIFRLCSPSRLK